MKKYLFLSMFFVSPLYAGFTTNNLTATSTFTVTQSTMILNGTTYYWPSGAGTSGYVLKTNGSTPATLTWGQAASPISFNYTFNADQAKLPGQGIPAISNSTNAVTASVLFDENGPETVQWSTILNPYQAGTLNADIQYSMVSGATGTVNWGIYVMCVSTGDAADVDIESFGAINSSSTVVPGTAGYLASATIVLTNQDTCALSDLIVIKLERTGLTNDTAAGDAEFRKLRIYE